MLFVFTLVLAAATVFGAVFLEIAPVDLEVTFLLSVGGVLGIGVFLGLLIGLFDRRHAKKRAARLQPLREGASALRWRPPSATTPPPTPAPPSESVPEPVPTPAPSPVPKAAFEPAPVAEPASTPSPPVKEASVSVEEAMPTPEPARDDKTVEFEGNLSTAASTASPPVEAVPAPAVVSEPTPALPPPDQVLHLASDFELSEVKRVMRIWQMTFKEGGDLPNQIARWTSSDGTTIDLFVKEDGFPYMEIRGAMADDFAEFLPQDLPVHPVLPEDFA